MLLWGFCTPELEQEFNLKRNRHLLWHDIGWLLFWGLLSVAQSLKSRTLSVSSTHQLLTLCYMAWAAPTLYLCFWRREWYIRHRVRIVTAMRLSRMLAVWAVEASWQEAALRLPSTPASNWADLAFKVCALQVSHFAFQVPMAHALPQALLAQLLTAHTTTGRCRLECTKAAAGACAGQPAILAGLSTAAGASGSTCAAGSPARQAALGFYSTVAGWIRRAVPGSVSAAQLPGSVLPASFERGGCLAHCFAVHGWLQVTFGTLLPVVLLWSAEESLRYAELRAWLQREQQAQQAASTHTASPPAAQGGAALQGSQGSQGSTANAERPLSYLQLASWCVGTALLFWLAMEAVFL